MVRYVCFFYKYEEEEDREGFVMCVSLFVFSFWYKNEILLLKIDKIKILKFVKCLIKINNLYFFKCLIKNKYFIVF